MMKGTIETMLSKSTEVNKVEYVDQESSSGKFTLVDPVGKTAQWWNYYMCFHALQHPELEKFAYCTVPDCGKHICIRNGTGGLKHHLLHKHREIYDEIMGLNVDLDGVSALLLL